MLKRAFASQICLVKCGYASRDTRQSHADPAPRHSPGLQDGTDAWNVDEGKSSAESVEFSSARLTARRLHPAPPWATATALPLPNGSALLTLSALAAKLCGDHVKRRHHGKCLMQGQNRVPLTDAAAETLVPDQTDCIAQAVPVGAQTYWSVGESRATNPSSTSKTMAAMMSQPLATNRKSAGEECQYGRFCLPGQHWQNRTRHFRASAASGYATFVMATSTLPNHGGDQTLK